MGSAKIRRFFFARFCYEQILISSSMWSIVSKSHCFIIKIVKFYGIGKNSKIFFRSILLRTDLNLVEKVVDRFKIVKFYGIGKNSKIFFRSILLRTDLNLVEYVVDRFKISLFYNQNREILWDRQKFEDFFSLDFATNRS